MKGAGAGRMKVKVRTFTDSSRASMHPLTNLIEVRCLIMKEEPSVPGSNPLPEPEDDNGLPTPEKAPHFFISSKASFEMETGTGNLGKFMVAFSAGQIQAIPLITGPGLYLK